MMSVKKDDQESTMIDQQLHDRREFLVKSGIMAASLAIPRVLPTTNALAQAADLVGMWTYRSFINNPDLSKAFNDLEFGRAKIHIEDASKGMFKGRIFDNDPSFPWSLDLKGSINYGNPYDLRFQGKGVVQGEEWVYDYEGYVIRPWPNGVDQRPAFVGTVVRTVAHSKGKSKAGVVASFIAVRQDDLK